MLTEPLTTNAYAAALDAVDVTPEDIPATIQAGADLLRAALDELGSWARPWRYTRLDNWPHAGYVGVDSPDPFGVVADVHATTNAGAYLELVGPQLARALVDWLDGAAERERRYRAELPPRVDAGAGPEDDDGPEQGDEAFAALVVAHTLMASRRGSAT